MVRKQSIIMTVNQARTKLTAAERALAKKVRENDKVLNAKSKEVLKTEKPLEVEVVKARKLLDKALNASVTA